MEHLLENLGLIQDGTVLPGFIFGVVHVSLVILGFYTGWSINRLLKNATKGYIAGIIGASLAHVIADLIAALIDPTMRARTAGIVLGGLLHCFLFHYSKNMSPRAKAILWLEIMRILRKI